MAGGPTRRKPFLVLKERLPADRYLDFDPPRNEMEVVWTFARIADVVGFEVDLVRTAFPDCVARWGHRKRRVRIEFESRSRHFEHHAHEASGCDLVVCWKHDWAGIPAGLQVLELRKLFGRAQDVFVQAYQDEFWSRLPPPRDRKPTRLWSVPSRAGAGDLLLVYRPETAGDEGAITDVFEVVTPVETVKSPDWQRRESRQRTRQRPDWMASIRRVAHLRDPLPYSKMVQLGIGGGIESRPQVTNRWPSVLREIERACSPSHSLRNWADVGT